ncbi:uncharacterized protein Gasu_57080 [Galdieria sulphuraria]|uniref:Uncharacterized protein n=1 Tax=Galdieria sulphuraria TaxID=130081 RepID=M2XTD6_GALSU|nr:uncharacterized protein Gasu_57080 [Galdieria sulphuraria]EME26704.1 hypothetical protein Gasu_57080 [Galdieria sulphuraria]|eukprot:XP_005703224.1 hypothetical protein Gasu_57080 [Galdieria sulphuraria]
MERSTHLSSQTLGVQTESQEEVEQPLGREFRNSRRRAALHPPEEEERETRRLRTLSPSPFTENNALGPTNNHLFLSGLSTRYRNNFRSENRRNNLHWRSNLSDTEGTRESRGNAEEETIDVDPWLSSRDGIEMEERDSHSEEHFEGRRALWRRIISRAPSYSNNRGLTASDTGPADLDPEEYFYHPTLFRSNSTGRSRPTRAFRFSREERDDTFEAPTTETRRIGMNGTSFFSGIPWEPDRPSNTSLRNWSSRANMTSRFQLYETGVQEDLLSSDSSDNSDQEISARPSGTRFIVRFMNRSQRTNGQAEDDEEQYDRIRISTVVPDNSRMIHPTDSTQQSPSIGIMTTTSTLETEEEENVECSSRLQFLLATDGPEDGRTHRLIISRFGLTGLILYRKLLTCGPFYPRSPARLLVHLAGYFLFFKDNSVLASRTHTDQTFLGRLLALDESEAGRLFDHLKTRDPMKLLMERLPPFSLLKRAIKGKRPFFHNGREALVIKFVLDIYDYYFKREVPLFETYRKKVLPLLELFYSHISQSVLDNVCYQQSKVLDRMKWVTDWSSYSFPHVKVISNITRIFRGECGI